MIVCVSCLFVRDRTCTAVWKYRCELLRSSCITLNSGRQTYVRVPGLLDSWRYALLHMCEK
jgi:hypothetical protein